MPEQKKFPGVFVPVPGSVASPGFTIQSQSGSSSSNGGDLVLSSGARAAFGPPPSRDEVTDLKARIQMLESLLEAMVAENLKLEAQLRERDAKESSDGCA